jgi:hypothetical protein
LVFLSKKPENKLTAQAVVNKHYNKEDNVTIAKDDIPTVTEKNTVTQINPVAEKLVEKSETKAVNKSVEKPAQIAAGSVKSSESLKKQEKVGTSLSPEVSTQVSTPVLPKQDDVPLFKGLFAYRANEPHYIAIYIVSGTIDFAKTKAAIDAYNAKNYDVLNLKVSLESIGKQQAVIIGSLSDASVAKSYLLRMVKEKALFEGLKGSNYRNLLGSQKNLNIVIQKNELKTYFEFMQEYYLK